MPGETTPHTTSHQNQSFSDSDLEPGVTTHTVARGEDAALYENSEGAQTGTNRQSERYPSEGSSRHGASVTDTVLEGSLKTRTPTGEGQGITNHATREESERQDKVVKQRMDALSAVNRS
ncbi:MAG TPA: hypothetical protein VGD62_08175 [Acidobacteriaceae bacterium]